jgi:hypothetical protein
MLCAGIMYVLLPWPQSLIWIDCQQNVFPVAHTNDSYLVSDWVCVVDAKPPSQTSAGSSLFGEMRVRIVMKQDHIVWEETCVFPFDENVSILWVLHIRVQIDGSSMLKEADK